MEIFEYIKTLGLPEWVVIIGALLFILSQLKLLDPILIGIQQLFHFGQQRIEVREQLHVEEKRESRKQATLNSLREQYTDSYLMEQVTTNHAETLVQLGSAHEFIYKEVSSKLDIVIELNNQFRDVVRDQSEIRTRLGEMFTSMNDLRQKAISLENNQGDLSAKMVDFYAELDIINRQLTEIIRNLDAKI